MASDKVSHNKDFFEQLADLLRPKLSVLNARASLCGKSAEELFKRDVKDGYQAEIISRNLKEKQFNGQSFYTLRQAAAAGFGIYPQVEFLLGRRSKKGKQAVPGVLRQMFELPEVSAKLAGQKLPDYVIIETIGDMPRNLDQAKEIQDEQKRRRKYKDELFEKYNIQDKQQDSEARKRALLHDQQGGSRGEAICPYTGESLGKDPLSPKLQIDHIFPEKRGGISEMVNLVLTHETTNNHHKGNQTPYEAFGGKQNTAEWRELCARVQKMGWNKQKRELVLREESSCPEWDNMTRMAQLARQLREEAARWLGVFGDDAKMRQKIGTPTGYQTSVCRESWSENLPEKNRSNLRHHLWDAAVISHIPPGKGMNLTNCAGIFFHTGTNQHGNITMLAIPGLGPDLNSFENATKDQCLVEKKKTNRSKKSRFQQWIYGFPDKNGQMWARDSLKSLADKANLLELLRDAGIGENQLPTSHFEEWQEKRKAQFFTREEAWAAVEALALPPEQKIPEPVFEEWWTYRFSGDKRKVDEKLLRILLAKAGVKETVSKERLASVLTNRGDPGPLTCKDGTPISSVSGTAKQMTPMAIVPHRNHKREIIGFKLATESFVRAEIWVTEKPTKDGKVELDYHCRLIPHPRGLANLRQRVMQCTGKQLTWERRLTDEELRELGLVKELETLNREREKISAAHTKAVQKWQKEQHAKSNTLDLAASPSLQPVEPKFPWLSLRKRYAGLPLCARRFTNKHGADISHIAKDDLLRVPLNSEGDICKRGESAYQTLWYRVSAINKSGKIEMKMAERKQIKPPSEKELRDGKRKPLTTDEQWRLYAYTKEPSSTDVLANLLEMTRANDQPPHPVK